MTVTIIWLEYKVKYIIMKDKREIIDKKRSKKKKKIKKVSEDKSIRKNSYERFDSLLLKSKNESERYLLL